MEPFLIGFLKTRHPRLGNYKTFPTVYLPLNRTWNDLKRSPQNDLITIVRIRTIASWSKAVTRSIVTELVLCHVTSTRTCTRTHNLVSTQVNMFSLEEERTSKWFSFTNTTCVHRSIFAFAWDRENSWNHILNKNFLIEAITRYSHEKKQKQSFRERVFSWESHETLMSFQRSWEKWDSHQ